MKSIGIFEAKTKLSEICDEVARSREPVTITRRGTALVTIEPAEKPRPTIQERRAAYLAVHGATEPEDPVDFAPPERSRERMKFRLKD